MEKQKKGKIEKLSDFFERVLPDSITIAFILMIIVIILAIALTGAPLITSTENQLSIVDSIGQNFWNLLAFNMHADVSCVNFRYRCRKIPARKQDTR